MLCKKQMLYIVVTLMDIGGSVMFELGYLIAQGAEVFFLERPCEELIEDLITDKNNIISPENLCEKMKLSNQIWQSRDWFDSANPYVSSFSFKKKPDLITTDYINGKQKVQYACYNQNRKDYISEDSMENL